MEYLYIYFILLALNAFSIISVIISLLITMINISNRSQGQYMSCMNYLNGLVRLPLADTLSRYFIPFYGVFMSGYLVYTFYFKYKDSLHPKYQFQFSEEDVNKFRIFKRNYK